MRWQNRLDLIDLWKAQKEEKLTVPELAKAIAKRIRELRCYEKEIFTLEEIADRFEYCEDDVEEFDDILNDLYDWGDISIERWKKMCWIATTF